MPRDALVDGHGRRIGDLRVSVTDRCNFRCQYCMPAEGLPWLDRDSVLTFEEIERVVGLLADMGVRDLRLTGGEPLVRRDFPKLAARLVPLVDELSVTTNGFLLERDAEALVARGRQPLQRVDRLAAARPLLRDDAPRRARPRPHGPRDARRLPRGAPDQGQCGRDARVHRGRGDPVRALRPLAPLRGALHRVHAAGRRPRLEPRERAHRRRDPRADLRGLAAGARAPRAARDGARVPLRRRPGTHRLHQPGQRAVLRRLQPDPPDGRGQAAHLPVLAARDRPAGAAAPRARPTTTSS